MQEQNNQIVAAKENFSQAFWVANGVEFLERLAYYADKIRFRSSIILAFSLLTLGYAGLVVLPSLLQGAGLVESGIDTLFTGLRDSFLKWSILPVLMAGGTLIGEGEVVGMHPVAFMMIVGIALGEEGLYLGSSHLHSFFSSLIEFISSGFLLEKFCPYPQSAQFSNSLYFASDYAAATANAHYIWFVFLGVDVVSAISLIIYGKIVNKDG